MIAVLAQVIALLLALPWAMAFGAARVEPDYKHDFIAFVDKFLPLNEKGQRWSLSPYQRRVLHLAIRFDAVGRLLIRLLLWGEIKKSGKTLLLACVGVWWATTRSYTEVTCAANDFDQSLGRVFATMVALVRHNGFERQKLCKVKAATIEFGNGTVVRAIASDYAGAAGSRHSLVIFDELWAYQRENLTRLYEELTPPPTEENAWVLVGTYAGFSGESQLLESMYQRGLAGERVDEDLEVYRADGGFVMFWSHTPRQSWQTPEYYDEQRRSLRPSTFARIHENRWVSAESSFITAEMWDACEDGSIGPLIVDDDRQKFGAADIAGVTQHATEDNDGTAVTVVQWDDDGKLRLAAHRIFKAPANFAEVESYIIELDRRFDVRWRVDPFQAARMQSVLRDAGVRIDEFPQTSANTTRMGETLFDLLRGGNLRLYPAPDLREQALSTVAVESTRGMRIAKVKSSRKIDAISALAMACVAAVEAGPESTTPWAIANSDGHRAWLAEHAPADDEDDVIDAEVVDEPVADDDTDYEDVDDAAPAPGRFAAGWTTLTAAARRAAFAIRAPQKPKPTTSPMQAHLKAQEREARARETARRELAAREADEQDTIDRRRAASAALVARQMKKNGSYWPGDFR